jgi:hypothetical protein
MSKPHTSETGLANCIKAETAQPSHVGRGMSVTVCCLPSIEERMAPQSARHQPGCRPRTLFEAIDRSQDIGQRTRTLSEVISVKILDDDKKE